MSTWRAPITDQVGHGWPGSDSGDGLIISAIIFTITMMMDIINAAGA